jgi:uncharacterized protein YdbL (DUF1318 family)
MLMNKKVDQTMNLNKLVAFRINNAQEAHLKEIAKSKHISLSTLIRLALNKEQEDFIEARRNATR